MTEEIAQTLVLGAGAYLALGFVLALVFVFRSLARLDGAADGANIWFRLFILPGVALLWPVIVMRRLSGRRINQPIESQNAKPDICALETTK